MREDGDNDVVVPSFDVMSAAAILGQCKVSKWSMRVSGDLRVAARGFGVAVLLFEVIWFDEEQIMAAFSGRHPGRFLVCHSERPAVAPSLFLGSFGCAATSAMRARTASAISSISS